VLPATSRYQAKPVATMSAPIRLSGRRYQAKTPTPVNPTPTTRSSTIQRARSGTKSVSTSSATSASPIAADAPASTQAGDRLSLIPAPR
jgi:hypothetical protein